MARGGEMGVESYLVRPADVMCVYFLQVPEGALCPHHQEGPALQVWSMSFLIKAPPIEDEYNIQGLCNLFP